MITGRPRSQRRCRYLELAAIGFQILVGETAIRIIRRFLDSRVSVIGVPAGSRHREVAGGFRNLATVVCETAFARTTTPFTQSRTPRGHMVKIHPTQSG